MIAPNDSAILYSPYNWDVTAGRAKTINAGAYFRVLVAGNPASIVLNFDVSGTSAPLPRVTYEIDGTPTTVELAATITVPLPAENTWPTHQLTFTVEATSETVDRWNAQTTQVAFTGITTTGTAQAPSARPLRVLTLGDSIAEGVRTLNKTAATDVERNSSRRTWAMTLAEILDAETGIVGFGGAAISHSANGSVPAMLGYWNTQWAGGPTRGVAATPPDYVVINIGTNDADATDITAGYTDLLNAILTAAPNTLVFCLLPFEGSHAAHIQAAALAATDPDRCIYVDTAGWWNAADSSDGLHPYGYTAPAVGRLAAQSIQAAAGTAPAPTPSAVNGFFFDLTNAAVPMSLTVT